MTLLIAVALLLLIALLLFLRNATPRTAGGKRYLLSPSGVMNEPVERFVWRRPEGAQHFQIELFAQDGTILWRENTADTTLALPETIILSSNRVYRWKVTYTFPDGVSLSTNDRAFEIPVETIYAP